MKLKGKLGRSLVTGREYDGGDLVIWCVMLVMGLTLALLVRYG